jgi:hypothetical protein
VVRKGTSSENTVCLEANGYLRRYWYRHIARKPAHRNAALRSSCPPSSSLSSWKPSSRSRLSLRSEISFSLDLSRSSLLCASMSKPTNPSPSSSSNKLPSPSAAPYRPGGGHPKSHTDGRKIREKASDIRERMEDVCCEMVSSGRYCAYLWRCWR